MNATIQNMQLADRILNILAEEQCTVRQAQEVLGFVSGRVRDYSEVQYDAGSLLSAKVSDL